MNRTTQSTYRTTPSSLATAVFLLCAMMITANVARAQANQLSLADILIGLRSKKVTLPERNKILSDAIVTRGTTFSLTPEIEKELAGGGADKSLIDSIRQRARNGMTAAMGPSPAGAKQNAESPAEMSATDFVIYEKRAQANVAKGDVDAALIDYTRAIEMNPLAVDVRLGRAAAYISKSLFTLAIADYTKVIETSPQNAAAYARRAEVHEKKGDSDLAAADYKKALEIDPANEAAKAYTARIDAALAKEKEAQKEAHKAAEKTAAVEAPPVVAKPVVIPEFVNLGLLTESLATRMVKPVYPALAFKSSIGGKVTVEVEISTDGSVVSAKAVDGHAYLRQASEQAARSCKFKPAMVGNVSVKAKGTIVYNFVPTR